MYSWVKQKNILFMKKLYLEAHKVHQILIVFDNEDHQQAVAMLLKRSTAFVATYVKSLKEACNALQTINYDIIVFGDFLVDIEHGRDDFCFLSSLSLHQSSVSIMVTADLVLKQKALSAGVDVVLAFCDIFLAKKLDCNFSLVPVVSIANRLL